MNVTIDREAFVRILGRVQGVVDKRHALAMLTNVLIEADDGVLRVVATDLEVSLQQTSQAKITKSGRAATSARTLFEIVRESPTDEITLKSLDNQWIEVVYGKSRFKLMGVDPQDHPGMPQIATNGAKAGSVEIGAGDLAEMVRKTVFAVSIDDTRSNLSGVFLTKGSKKGSLRMVATDGYRLSLIDRAMKTEIPELEKGILLPKKGLAELSRLLEEEGEQVWIKLKNNNLIIKKENVVLIMRLLDAEFPDYNQVIPSQTKRHIRIKRGHLLESLKRVSILSSEKTKGVKFHFGENLLELSSYNPDFGEAKEELSVEYMGEELTVGFNYRFVLEVLNILNSEEIIMEFEDGVSPAVIRPANDEKHTCVVMPMRI